MSDKPQLPALAQQPAGTCGATTVGMYGRLLGPCINNPTHPTGTVHRDSHGAEWLEYDHTTEDAK